jgi:hypothetical protein
VIEIVQLVAARASRRRQPVLRGKRDLVESVDAGCRCRGAVRLIRQIESDVKEARQVHAHGAARIQHAEATQVERLRVAFGQAR